MLPQYRFREQIAPLGRSSFHQISASFFDEWLEEEAPVFHPAWRVVLWITAALNVALLTAGFVHLRTWGDLCPNLAMVLAVQGAISMYLRPRVMPLLQAGARLELTCAAGGWAMTGCASRFTCSKRRSCSGLR